LIQNRVAKVLLHRDLRLFMVTLTASMREAVCALRSRLCVIGSLAWRNTRRCKPSDPGH
jgi:hypothetical protein